jgi:hypothetical protein
VKLKALEEAAIREDNEAELRDTKAELAVCCCFNEASFAAQEEDEGEEVFVSWLP